MNKLQELKRLILHKVIYHGENLWPMVMQATANAVIFQVCETFNHRNAIYNCTTKKSGTQQILDSYIQGPMAKFV